MLAGRADGQLDRYGRRRPDGLGKPKVSPRRKGEKLFPFCFLHDFCFTIFAKTTAKTGAELSCSRRANWRKTTTSQRV